MPGTHHSAHDKDRHGERDPLRREAVANDRIGLQLEKADSPAPTIERAIARTAETACEAASSSAHAPHRHTQKQHPAAAVFVERETERDCTQAIEHCKGWSLQQADLKIGKAQILLDRSTTSAIRYRSASERI